MAFKVAMFSGYPRTHPKEKHMARRKHHKKRFGSKTASKSKFAATARKCGKVKGKAAKKACWKSSYR
jgi:hypothetical protein